MTLAEDRPATRVDHFAVKYSVDEEDCFDFAAGLAELGHDVFFVNWDDLKGRQFLRMFHYNERRFVVPLPLPEFKLAFVYKMEGFLFHIARFFYMVGLFAETIPVVVNHPRTIRHNIDKRYYWDLKRKGVNIIPVYFVDESLRDKIASGGRFVLKPKKGERGRGIFLASAAEDLAAIEGRERDYIAQEYRAEIRDGERSLVYLGFEFQHAVIKRPSPANADEFRCNESLGGTVELYEPAADELAYAQHVLRTYASLGCPVHFSRIDLIRGAQGPMLIEAELLNPSIYANYSKKGREFGRKLAAYFHRLIEQSSEQRARAAYHLSIINPWQGALRH